MTDDELRAAREMQGEFERWMDEHGYGGYFLQRDGASDVYASPATSLAWKAWQSAAAHYLALGRAQGLEEGARVCEKRAERRWEEHGYTEPDTNASYYPKQYEWCETADEEANDCAAAIRALAEGGER